VERRLAFDHPFMNMLQVAAAYRGVSKSFGATHALRDINLEIEAGTVHALLGENGAGKSTALGILAGRIAPSAGSVELFGQTLPALNPRESRAAGLAAIYQELTIVPALSAEANVFVGQPLSRLGMLSGRPMRRRYEELCARLDVRPVAPGTPAGALSVADQQLLEIMRALASEARMILFDEPTASLGITERGSLLRLMRQLRAKGTTIVFVSHNIDEVLEVADVITVFRGGRHVSTVPRRDVSKHAVVRSMLGEEADLRFLRTLEQGATDVPPAHRAQRALEDRAPALRVEGLTLPGAVENVDLEVGAGEILGLGGLVGCGRTSVLRALAGLEPRSTGRMWVDDREVDWPRTVRRARTYGIALAPEDRKQQGLVLEMPASTNVAMSDLSAVSTRGWISQRRVTAAAREAVQPFKFDSRRVDEPAGRLSGGNQQKLLLARWVHLAPRVLLADEPTRGIDIAAKEHVMSALEHMAWRGVAVIIVSSELEELIVVSDRVDVLAEGRLVGRLDRDGTGISVPQILDAAFAVGGTA
jgi:rhamnose transport system ATP-binding protein